MDKFQKIIKDEYEWCFWGSDSEKILLDQLENKITAEEFEANFDLFVNEAAKRVSCDEYVIQTLHDMMHDTLYDVTSDFINNKDEFIDKYKLDEEQMKLDQEQEIIEMYNYLKLSDIAEETLNKYGYVDKEKQSFIKEIEDLYENEKSIQAVKISYVYEDGEEDEYEITKTFEGWVTDKII